jgi:uncharacterized protein (DUF2236 family)
VSVDDVERFASNGALIAGGACAILLQVADPVVGAAVARHSDFAHRPLDRLHNTLTFVYAVVLGTGEEAARVAAYVDRAHRGIPGATSPEHQLWVAATLYATAVQVHERLYGPVALDLREALLARYAPLATSLQVPLADWPTTAAAFDAYWLGAAAHLEVTPETRGVAHDLFHPVTIPWWGRIALPFVSALTSSLLTPQLRDAFGLPAHPRRSAAAWHVARAAARLAPRRLREWPSRYYLRRLRAR